MLDAIKQTAQGVAILKDWLGGGGEPVPRVIAEHRSSFCLQCPHNVAPKWWDKAKEAVAENIRQHLEVKNQVGLTLSNEDRLHMCRKCGCCLTLKLHVPFEHIHAHTSQKVYDSLPVFCWMLAEKNDHELQQSH
jgi:hypothetical protein